jgi:hypothetical protein
MYHTDQFFLFYFGKIGYLARPDNDPYSIQILKILKPNKDSNDFLHIFSDLDSLLKYTGITDSSIIYKLQILTHTNLVCRVLSPKQNNTYLNCIIPDFRNSNNPDIQGHWLATSANLPGQIPATNSQQLKTYFPKIQIICETRIGNNFLEPAVIQINQKELTFLRPGEVSETDIYKIFPNTKVSLTYPYFLTQIEKDKDHNIPKILISTKEYKNLTNITNQLILGSNSQPITILQTMIAKLWNINQKDFFVQLVKPAWKNKNLSYLIEYTVKKYFPNSVIVG